MPGLRPAGFESVLIIPVYRRERKGRQGNERKNLVSGQ